MLVVVLPVDEREVQLPIYVRSNILWAPSYDTFDILPKVELTYEPPNISPA